MFSRLCLLLTLWLCATHCTAQDYTPEVQQKITQVEHSLGSWAQATGDTGWTIQQRMKHYHVNGVSIAVISNYKIAWAKGYGLADSAAQKPVTVNTLFQAASISKSLNGVGVLKLAQNGRLYLCTDINNYLKTWKFPYSPLSADKKITAINLLSHTAGLTVHGFPGYEAGDKIPSLPQILNGAKPANSPAVRSMLPPSSKMEYSGGGIEILQMMVEDITGMPYEKYMTDSILIPLGMTNSTYSKTINDKLHNMATAYYANGKEVKGKYHTYPESAAAGLCTTPADLAKYIIETQLSLEGRSAKVLNKEMTTLRLTPYIDSESALGVFVAKRGARSYFCHNGFNEGFVSLYYGSMDGGDGVVIMTNTDKSPMMYELLNSVAKVYQWKDFYMPELKEVIPVNDSIANACAGKYQRGDRIINIRKEGNGLVYEYEDDKYNLFFTSGADFFCYELRDCTFTFLKDGNKITGFMENGDKTKIAHRL